MWSEKVIVVFDSMAEWDVAKVMEQRSEPGEHDCLGDPPRILSRL
jgi:hypothetical protein